MSVAPLTSLPASAAAETTVVVSEKALDRTGKIVPLFIAVLSIVLMIAAWYGAQQAQKAYLDTLITERGAKNEETRKMVVDLRDRYETSERANAEFRGRTDASLQSIKDALLVERADRRDRGN